jgi:cyclopropane fatty-acyl-phospholipid synthase-like methyltransferase
MNLKNLLHRLFFTFLYLGDPPWDTGISPPELIAFIESHPPGRALDLGCGTGTNVITMAQHGWQVTGVDFIPSAIHQARRKARKVGIVANFQVDDVARLQGISGPFDLILDIGCFHSLSSQARQAYAKSLDRLLAPRGTYLLYAFIKESGDETNGLDQNDLSLLERFLHQDQRQDGTERGRKPSAWFTYRKRAHPEIGGASH